MMGCDVVTRPFAAQPPEIQKRLLCRETVADAYAHATIKDAAAQLGVGQHTMEKALDYHGIKRRKRGESPPPRDVVKSLTRRQLRVVVQRAYDKAGRCPMNCPGRAECNLGDENCVMEGGE